MKVAKFLKMMERVAEEYRSLKEENRQLSQEVKSLSRGLQVISPRPSKKVRPVPPVEPEETEPDTGIQDLLAQFNQQFAAGRED